MNSQTMTAAQFVRFARCMRKIGATQISAGADGSFSASFATQGRQQFVIPQFADSSVKERAPKKDEPEDKRSDRERYRDEALGAFRGS